MPITIPASSFTPKGGRYSSEKEDIIWNAYPKHNNGFNLSLWRGIGRSRIADEIQNRITNLEIELVKYRQESNFYMTENEQDFLKNRLTMLVNRRVKFKSLQREDYTKAFQNSDNKFLMDVARSNRLEAENTIYNWTNSDSYYSTNSVNEYMWIYNLSKRSEFDDFCDGCYDCEDCDSHCGNYDCCGNHSVTSYDINFPPLS